jgi:hypothetical protein
MKCRFLQTILAIVAITCIWGCKTETTGSSDEVNILLNLEKEAIEREFQSDTAFLSSIMDSTFIELSQDKIKNKHEVLKTMVQDNISRLENKISLDSFRLEYPIVNLYDDASVVTFILHTFRKKEDSLFERRTRFYDVWVKREGEWKAVTWQATPL